MNESSLAPVRPSADASEALEFPIHCERLRACFTFDLRKPAGLRELCQRWFFDPSYRAVVSLRIAQWLHQGGRIRLAKWVLVRMRVATGAEIHETARIGPRLRLPHPNGVVIGGGVVIGPDVTILQQVTIGGPGREIDTGSGRRYPVIGARVYVYAGAKIVGPMTIGADASIGANAVVVSDVPDGALAVGVPARVIAADERGQPRRSG
jgi:serine O-acetyltransferase